METRTELRDLTDYLQRMVDLSRVVSVSEDGKPIAWMTFFLCDNVNQVKDLYLSGLWDTPLDNPAGVIIYIDKVVCSRKWTISIRRELERVVLERYPQLKFVVWHRPTGGNDRLVVREIGRRLLSANHL